MSAAAISELKESVAVDVASSPSTDDALTTGFEVDRDLHQAIGNLAGNYPCVYDNTKGTLFAGSGGVSFVGWTLFFHKRVDMDWTGVLQVVKTERSDVSTSISFIMREHGVEYDFDGIQNSERVWATLVNLHNEALHRDSNNRQPSLLLTPLRKSLRRMSTDPLYSSTPHERDGGTIGPSGTEAAYIAAAAVASDDDVRSSVSSRNLAASSVACRQSLMSSSPLPVDGKGCEIKKDLQDAWTELQKGGSDKQSYATSAIVVSKAI